MTDWLEELDRLEREATPGPWCPSEYLSQRGADFDLAIALRNHARELIRLARIGTKNESDAEK